MFKPFVFLLLFHVFVLFYKIKFIKQKEVKIYYKEKARYYTHEFVLLKGIRIIELWFHKSGKWPHLTLEMHTKVLETER